ncbi:hypothetical protein [uncultured Gilliamella sp.]|uniref:hypothetical protein n=2 Tax=Gilliamella TaxID=1193503 RepID=UPI0025D5771C|nr:hypothetical protein [uncultured Gilliamella sp.]
MIILIYIAYYFISIMPIIIAYRFRKYTISDFQNNKKLKWQRRIMLVLSYIVAFFEAFIVGQRKAIHNYNSDYELLLFSSGVFTCIYIFSIGWLESPKEYLKKKKKWK